MSLNKLKPAWSQLKLHNSLFAIKPEEVLGLIEYQEKQIGFKPQRIISNATMFLMLIFFCQGG